MNPFGSLMLPQLQILDMGYSYPSDKNVQDLLIVVGLKLKKLCLAGCRSITDEGIKDLNAPELESLDIRGTDISATGLQNILQAVLWNLIDLRITLHSSGVAKINISSSRVPVSLCISCFDLFIFSLLKAIFMNSY